MEIHPTDLGKNNPDKTAVSEEDGNYLGHGPKVHMGETADQWLLVQASH